MADPLESFDEKKEDPPIHMDEPQAPPPAAAPPPTPTTKKMFLSPSQRRAQNTGGLSELSKQLRIYQAKNEAQAVEINRLERQLRILAELQGISVADLRNALENACANEAFGEMQHRVAKLRAQLEAATLQKQMEMRQDAAAPHIANLELKVGELEEMEEKQRGELHHLYEQLKHERAKSARLQDEADQHKKDANDYLQRMKKEGGRASKLEANFQEQLQKLQEEHARLLQQQAVLARQAAQTANSKKNAKDPNEDAGGSAKSAGTAKGTASISPEMAAEYERIVKLLKDKDAELKASQDALAAEEAQWRQKLRNMDGHNREAQVRSKVDQDEMSLTIKQLQDVDSQNELRLAQFKARFAMQDERLQDRDQQLNSLYTAFGLIKEDQQEDDLKRVALASNLDDADAELARQMEENQRKKSGDGSCSRRDLDHEGVPPSPSSRRNGGSRARINSHVTPSKESGSPGADGVPRVIRTTPSTLATSSPGMASQTPTARATPLPRFLTGSPQRTPTTWQLLFPEPGRSPSRSGLLETATPDQNGVLASGLLIVKSNSVIRPWKNKYAKLYLRGEHCQLNVGDWKSFTLGFGISKVEFNPNHPLSFVINTNPFDPEAPVIQAATANEEDYHRWMSALTKATTGGDYQVASQEASPRRLEAAAAQSSSRSFIHSASGDSQRSTASTEEKEASDLQMALELSKTLV